MTVIGIDLGTSNTVVAHVVNGEPVTITDASGRRMIPSIVSFHPSGTVLVGDAAKMRRFNDSVNTVAGAKRLMGRAWGTPEIEELRRRLPYELREGKHKTVSAVLRGETYAIPELSAFVLRKANAWAEAAIGQPVKKAVITVPANFHELQRQATKLAGELAELEVVRVLNEPTAAAIAYGHVAATAKEEQIAVYDFGGGTFDLTMLRMSEQELRVRATSGDMFLGGDDVDTAIADRIANAYLATHRYDPRADPDVYARVRVAAERLKVDLSTEQEATVALDELMYGHGGKAIDWSFTMKRSELDAILDPFIDRSIKVCVDALALMKATVKDIDRVVLVGGSTLSPRVRDRVGEFFGRLPATGVDPEEAVALGAALSGTVALAAKPARAPGPAPSAKPVTGGAALPIGPRVALTAEVGSGKADEVIARPTPARASAAPALQTSRRTLVLLGILVALAGAFWLERYLLRPGPAPTLAP